MDSTSPGFPKARPWQMAILGTLLQLALGTVYAWSYFQKPIMAAYGWNNAQVAWVFSLSICFLGLSAAWGGSRLATWGPRRMAMVGGILFGSGYLLGALALHLNNLPLLYAGYGIIGGCGLGLGYVTPVATVAKWFPHRKGLATGMVIMGFGLGALLMSKAFAPWLLATFHGDLVRVFAALGAVFLVWTLAVSWFLRNPQVALLTRTVTTPADSTGLAPILRSRPFILIWLVFFCNTVAGISIIGFQSPLLQDLLSRGRPGLDGATLAAAGATLIGVSSLFNGLGRIFWGAFSDRLGPLWIFRLMLGTEVLCFAGMVFIREPGVFVVAVCYLLLCYGGGFGTVPSFVLDTFGPSRMPAIYGALLTAWSAAGIVGPQMVALMKDRMGSGAHQAVFLGAAGVVTIGFSLSFFITRKYPLSR